MLAKILGLWVAEMLGGLLGAAIGHSHGYGENAFIVGVLLGGLVHIVLGNLLKTRK